MDTKTCHLKADAVHAVLGDEIKEVLDRRKTGLLDSSAMSSEDRGAVMQQLMALVARLEEEMFQSEAHKFEAEVLSCSERFCGSSAAAQYLQSAVLDYRTIGFT